MTTTNVINHPARRVQPKVRILSSSEFAASWKPPEFVIDGILQRRYLYAVTAKAGTGKTAIALTLAAHVGLGRPLGEHDVTQGRVLYFAGENPDDIRTRWLLLAEEMAFDLDLVPVDFIDGAFSLKELIGEVRRAASTNGPYALVIVDTSAAYFSGDDDNSNVQAQQHAATMRKLVDLPGGPCVVVAAHPPKIGGKVPRGGSAFLNEIDGNTYLEKADSTVFWKQDLKFRGPVFTPLTFKLVPITSKQRVDAKGHLIKSVKAVALGPSVERNEMLDRPDKLISAMEAAPGASIDNLALATGLHRNKVHRKLRSLQKQGITRQDVDKHWYLAEHPDDSSLFKPNR
jgi:hypothetical protein